MHLVTMRTAILGVLPFGILIASPCALPIVRVFTITSATSLRSFGSGLLCYSLYRASPCPPILFPILCSSLWRKCTERSHTFHGPCYQNVLFVDSALHKTSFYLWRPQDTDSSLHAVRWRLAFYTRILKVMGQYFGVVRKNAHRNVWFEYNQQTIKSHGAVSLSSFRTSHSRGRNYGITWRNDNGVSGSEHLHQEDFNRPIAILKPTAYHVIVRWKNRDNSTLNTNW